MIAGFKILIICDTSSDADELGAELLAADYDISLLWVNSVAALRDGLAEDDFDLVLCDDKTDSIDTVSARDLISESGQDIPFIVISRAMTAEAQKIASQMKAGVDDFVEWGKPARLIPAVERALRTSEIRRQHRLAEKEMHYRANFDSLTDLPNRTLMLDRLSQAMKKSRRDNTGVLLMFLDLDHFKSVNDSLGHLAGDQLLRKAAKRIAACLRDTDTAARVGGDEFAIILPEANQLATAEAIADKLLKSLSEPFDLDCQQASISASIGITVFPEDGEDAETLLKNADAAMYESKRIGRNAFTIFQKESETDIAGSDTLAATNVIPLKKTKFLSMPFKQGLAIAAALALLVVAATMLTSMDTKESFRLAIQGNSDTLPGFSTASGPED